MKGVPFLFFVLSLSSALLIAPRAEETNNQAEAEEAAREDEEAAKIDGEIKSPLKGIDVKGTFTLQTAEPKAGTVLGSLKSAAKTYMVKADSDETAKLLAKLKGQEIMVLGKERNKGKYLIVSIVTSESDPPPPRRKNKGF